VAEYVPSGHLLGVTAPTKQKDPAGHKLFAGLLTLAPLPQRNPAIQDPVTMDRPNVSQNLPDKQGKHCELLCRRRTLLKVPGGHCRGDMAPVGQNEPAGQAPAAAPWLGVGDVAPETQK